MMILILILIVPHLLASNDPYNYPCASEVADYEGESTEEDMLSPISDDDITNIPGPSPLVRSSAHYDLNTHLANRRIIEELEPGAGMEDIPLDEPLPVPMDPQPVNQPAPPKMPRCGCYDQCTIL